MRLLPLFLLAALLFAPGCFFSRRNINAEFDRERVERLEPGQTTAREVVELLGAPNEVVQLGRRSAYRYDHTHQREEGLFLIVLFLHGTDVKSDRVWVFFDEDLVLTHVGSTFEADNAEYGIPPFDKGSD
jgi:outer membrane protein assembly factor BamE (lipoprotein component of BamABCDE complex)